MLQSGQYKLMLIGSEYVTASDEVNAQCTRLSSIIKSYDSGGMIKYNDEGIQKIVKAFNGDVTDLTDRLNAVIDAGKNYNNYSGKSSNMNGSVKFVIETEAIGE